MNLSGWKTCGCALHRHNALVRSKTSRTAKHLYYLTPILNVPKLNQQKTCSNFNDSIFILHTWKIEKFIYSDSYNVTEECHFFNTRRKKISFQTYIVSILKYATWLIYRCFSVILVPVNKCLRAGRYGTYLRQCHWCIFSPFPLKTVDTSISWERIDSFPQQSMQKWNHVKSKQCHLAPTICC